MDSQLKFAAIDIGSNAVRLLLSGVFEDGDSRISNMHLVTMWQAFANGSERYGGKGYGFYNSTLRKGIDAKSPYWVRCLFILGMN